MDILKYLLILLIIIFPIAEIGSVQFGSIAFTLNDVFLISTFSVWSLLNFKKIKFNQYKLAKPILIFVSVGILSLVLNPLQLGINAFITSFLYLLRWVLYSSIYFMLVSQDKKFIIKFSDILVIPITIILAIGYIQFFFYQSLRNLFYLGWDEHLYRFFGSFLDPNFAGAYLSLSLIFLIYKMISSYKERSRIKSVFLVLLTFFNFFAIYLTYSRSSLIMLFVSIVIFLLFIKKIKAIFVLLILIIIFIFISPRSFQTEGTNLLRVFSSQARIESAQIALNIIEKHPIFGVGFNSYRYAQNKYANLTDANWQITHSGAGTDNSYLFVLAITGIVGLLAYLYLLYSIFNLGKHKFYKNQFAVVLIASIVGLLINSIFINSLFYVYIMEWIWIMTAITENS